MGQTVEMMRSGRWSIAGPLVAAALVASACGGGSDTGASSSAVPSSTAPVTSAPDDFTDVVNSDVVNSDVVASSESSPSSTAVAPGGTVVDGSDDADPDPDTSSTSTSPTAGGETPTNTNPSGSVADGPDQTSPSTASSTTSTSTSTTAPARTTGESQSDRALAVAFTAQLDVDDEGFGEVFDTTCLGTEFVVAFGGAAAADADYTLNLTTVTVENNLFNDEPLSKAAADAVVAAFGRCGDFDDLLALDLSGSAAEDELGRCVVDAIPDGTQEAALSEDFQQIDGPALDAFDDAVDDAFDLCFG